jgi:hypothetical protein
MTSSGTPSPCHLDRVGVAQVTRREQALHSGTSGRVVQLYPDSGWRPRPPKGGPAQDAEQRTDRKRGAQRQPGSELLPGPAVHPDLAALVAFATADQPRAPIAVKITFGQREGFADQQPGSPQHDDQAAQPYPVAVITGGAHHGSGGLTA